MSSYGSEPGFLERLAIAAVHVGLPLLLLFSLNSILDMGRDRTLLGVAQSVGIASVEISLYSTEDGDSFCVETVHWHLPPPFR